MITLKNIYKTYSTKSCNDVHALKNINIKFPNVGLVFILGPSGSGKSSMLNILGGIDTPSNGELFFNEKVVGIDIPLGQYRRNYVGFVFQEFNLIPELDVYHNVLLGISQGVSNKNEKVKSILNEVGLSGYEKRKINELSGGQKQRVAIARSLAKKSNVLLCDEPTGNLDSTTSDEIFTLLKNISKKQLVIVVTHNEEFAHKYSESIVKIVDGEIVENTISIEEEYKYSEINNHTTLSTILKYSIVNLFSSKIKTLISFLLVTLSLVSSCIMLLCLTYNPQSVIANSISDDSIYLVKNTSDSGFGNINHYRPIYDDISNIVSNDKYSERYDSAIGGVYIINENNISILDNHDFYKKNDLLTGSAYITDYYLDYIINKDSCYQKIEYSEYEDVINQDVIFYGKKLFSIAGVIKTNYKEYYDENSNVPSAKEYYDNKRFDFENDLRCYNPDKYDVCYMNLDTFNSIDMRSYAYFFKSNQNDEIKLSYNTRNCELEEFFLHFFNDTKLDFYTKDGEIVTTISDSFAPTNKVVELNENDVIISQGLYEVLFNVTVDWDNIYYNANQGLNTSNVLPYIGSTISINTKSNNYIINKKVNVAGVYTREDSDCMMYGFKDTFDAKNDVILKKTIIELDWKNINNKKEVLQALRDNNNILVHGVAANKIYATKSNYLNTGLIFACLSVVLIITSIFAIINLINTKINDKKREIGILYGIGLSKFEINLMFFIPMFIIMILSSIITFIGSEIIISVFNNLMIVRPYEFIKYFSLNLETILFVIGMNLILSIFSILPISVYLKKKPIDIIR